MRLTKHIFTRLNLDDELIDVSNIEFVDARNIVPSKDGNGKRIEKAPGTVAVSLTLPSGTNRCVGKVADNDKNCLYLLVYNSNDDHSIVKVTSDATASVVLTWPGLGFTGAKVPHIAINDGVLFWAEDGAAARCLNLTRVENSELTASNLSVDGTLLLKVVPRDPLLVSYANTPSMPNNELLYSNKYKVAYRIVYIDGEVSALSPNTFSTLRYAYSDTPPTLNMNTLQVAWHPTGDDLDFYISLGAFIKSVEFFVKKNNEPYRKVKSIPRADLYLSTTMYDGICGFDYYGEALGEVLSNQEADAIHDDVFDEISGLEVADSRLMIAGTSKGVELSVDDMGIDHNPDWVSSTYGRAKEGEDYEIGLILYDKHGRKYGAISHESWTKSIPRLYPNFPSASSGTLAYSRNNLAPRNTTAETQLSVKATGTPPDWAYKYQFAIRARKIQNSCMAACKIRFLVAEEEDSTEYQKRHLFTEYGSQSELGSLVLEVDQSGAIYLLKEYANVTGYVPQTYSWNGMIDIELPDQFPFTPDETYFVRLAKEYKIRDGFSYPQDRVFKVRKVNGNKVRINLGLDYYDYLLWRGWSYDGNRLFVEIFNQKAQSTGEPFVEASDILSISEPGTVDRAFDTSYTLLETGWEYKVANLGTFDYTPYTNNSGVFEAGTETNAVNEDIGYEANSPFNVIGLGYRIGSSYQTNAFSKEQSAERYNISLGTGGRYYPGVFKDLETINPRGIVKYSQKYVAGSNINGLRDFITTNEYPLPVGRGAVKKLVQAFDTVMLSIHEKETSSLYIGEGYISTADGNKILTKTEGVIGDSRELRGDFGTMHPESVHAYDGRVIWFDFHSAEIVRYDLNGITPLAKTYKIKKYLKELCDSLRPYLGDFNVNTGYNKYLNLYYIHFTPFVNGEFTFSGVTLVYNNREGAEGFFGFSDLQSDEFLNLNNDFFAMNAGSLAKTSYSGNRSKYFGTSYSSTASISHAEQPSREKIYRSLIIEGDSPWKAEVSNPEGQATDIETDEYEKIDDLHYGEIRCDVNTHSDLLDGKPAILFGEEIRSRIVTVKLTENSDNSSRNMLESVDVGYIEAPNHFVSAEK